MDRTDNKLIMTSRRNLIQMTVGIVAGLCPILTMGQPITDPEFKLIAEWNVSTNEYVKVSVKNGEKLLYSYATPGKKAFVRDEAEAVIRAIMVFGNIPSATVKYVTVNPRGEVQPSPHWALKSEIFKI